MDDRQENYDAPLDWTLRKANTDAYTAVKTAKNQPLYLSTVFIKHVQIIQKKKTPWQILIGRL